MSSEFVVNGAPLACNNGSSPGALTSTTSPTSIMSGQMIATIADGVSGSNIPSFGQCGATLVGCQPATSAFSWTGASPVLTAGSMSLIIGSSLPCNNGGTISVLSSGQIPVPGGGPPPSPIGLVSFIFTALTAVLALAGALFMVVGILAMVAGLLITIATAGIGALLGVPLSVAGLGFLGLGIAVIVLAGVVYALGRVLTNLLQTLADLLQAITGIPLAGMQGLTSPNMYCFRAGTPVHTKFGLKNIENIKVGDLVKSYDLIQKSVIISKVLNVFENTAIEIVEIITLEEVIRTTKDHPFYVNGEFKSAESIKKGDFLFTCEDMEIQVLAVNILSEREKVYNFEVEESMCYFAGKIGALVLNTC